MSHEQFIAELAALREKHTLDEVIELVLEGLGGRDKVDAELDARDGVDADDDGEETPDPLTVMRDADVARLETIQGMAESFCTWLHAKGEAQMKQDTDAAVDKVQQLSASFNKAARAVRLSMMLKHEVVGLRPLPQSRAAAAAGPANENGAPKGGNRPRRVYGDWPDNTDEERAEYADTQKMLTVYLKKTDRRAGDRHRRRPAGDPGRGQRQFRRGEADQHRRRHSPPHAGPDHRRHPSGSIVGQLRPAQRHKTRSPRPARSGGAEQATLGRRPTSTRSYRQGGGTKTVAGCVRIPPTARKGL